jgi:hypothetical protein
MRRLCAGVGTCGACFDRTSSPRAAATAIGWHLLILTFKQTPPLSPVFNAESPDEKLRRLLRCGRLPGRLPRRQRRWPSRQPQFLGRGESSVFPSMPHHRCPSSRCWRYSPVFPLLKMGQRAGLELRLLQGLRQMWCICWTIHCCSSCSSFMCFERHKTGKNLRDSQTRSNFPQHVFIAMRLGARVSRGSDMFRDLIRSSRHYAAARLAKKRIEVCHVSNTSAF